MITVIIPCYQAEATLQATLDCIPKEVPIVAVNDGSTDSTKRILESAQGSHTLSIINHPANLGLGAARNGGILGANTDYVVFLDADDRLTDGFFPALIGFLTAHPESDWLYHPYKECLPSGKCRERQGQQPKSVEDLVTRHNPLSPSGAILKRETLLQHGGFDTDRQLQGTEDLDLWARLIHAGLRPTQWSRTAYTLYRTRGGMTENVHLHAQKVAQRIRNMVAARMINRQVEIHAMQELSRQVARTHHKAGRFAEAIKAYRLSPPSLKRGLLMLAAGLRWAI